MIDGNERLPVEGHAFAAAMWGARVGVVLPRQLMKDFIAKVAEFNDREAFGYIAKISRSSTVMRVDFKDGGQIKLLPEGSEGVGRGLVLDVLFMRHGVSNKVKAQMLPTVVCSENPLVIFF